MHKNTWLIFAREIRDTMRDRRTLFVMIVLPLLLYPLLLLGISRLVIYQSLVLKGKPARIASMWTRGGQTGGPSLRAAS